MKRGEPAPGLPGGRPDRHDAATHTQHSPSFPEWKRSSAAGRGAQRRRSASRLATISARWEVSERRTKRPPVSRKIGEQIAAPPLNREVLVLVALVPRRPPPAASPPALLGARGGAGASSPEPQGQSSRRSFRRASHPPPPASPPDRWRPLASGERERERERVFVRAPPVFVPFRLGRPKGRRRRPKTRLPTRHIFSA